MDLPVIIGFVGVALILLGYILIALEIIEVKTYSYAFVILLGSIGLLYDALTRNNWSAVTINGTFGLMSIVLSIKVFLVRKKPKKQED